MQTKLFKTTILAALLMSIAMFTSANAAANTGTNQGWYISGGYTFGWVSNGDIKNYQILMTNGNVDPVAYGDEYAHGKFGANAKFGQFLTPNWGYEINFNILQTRFHGNYYNAAVPGSSNVPDVTLTGQSIYQRQLSVFYAEALGIYDWQLNNSFDILPKIGVGYERQRDRFSTLINLYQEQTILVNSVNQYSDSTHHSAGIAGAAEIRYHATQHVALGLELNDLAAKQNVIAINANVVVSF